MKRPVATVALALILGEVFAAAGVRSVYVFLLAAVSVVFLLTRLRRHKCVPLLFACVFMLAGYCVTAQETDTCDLARSLNDSRAEAKGLYRSCRKTDFGYQYYLRDVSLRAKGKTVLLRRLLVYCEEKPVFEPGCAVNVSGKLKPFSSARNEGNFDAARYYRSAGIYTALDQNEAFVTGASPDRFRPALSRLRDDIKSALYELCDGRGGGIFKLCDPEKAGILSAILLGDKSGVSDETQSLYQSGGISHVLAISGLHISALGMFVYTLLRRRFRIVSSGCICAVFVTGFVLMSGSSVSAVRAYCMFLFFLVSKMAGRRYDMTSAMSFSAILLCLDNPFVLLNAGFQMSFGAIFAIAAVYPVLRDFFAVCRKKARVGKADITRAETITEKCGLCAARFISGALRSLTLSASIQLVILPVIARQYFEIPLFSVFLNLIVLPLMSVALWSSFFSAGFFLFLIRIFKIQSALAVILPAARILILPACAVLSLFDILCSVFTKIPGNIFVSGCPSSGQIILYCAVLAAFLFVARLVGKKRKARENDIEVINEKGRAIMPESEKTKKKRAVCGFLKICGTAGCAALLILIISAHPDDMLHITFLDVGQGDGITLQKESTVILIDGGSSDVRNVGENRIVTSLKSRGIRTIDAAVVTHADSDHISGLMEMLEDTAGDRMIIESLYLPVAITRDEACRSLITAADSAGTSVYFLEKGDRIVKGDVVITCLHPFRGFNASERNAYSTVLSLKYGEFKALFTGDISSGEEQYIFDTLDRSYTVLKVPHHGSRYSTSEALLKTAAPRYCVISCGKDNSYGHPHTETLERINGAGSSCLRTDTRGQISFDTDGEKYRVRTIM